MRIKIQSRYGAHVSTNFTDSELNDVKAVLENVAANKMTYLSFHTDNGDMMYFPEKILKTSIISLIPE